MPGTLGAASRWPSGSGGVGRSARQDAAARLARFGPNRLEPAKPTSTWRTRLHQFQSPLIYILLVATVVAASLCEYRDASFIVVVLLLNAALGEARNPVVQLFVLFEILATATHDRNTPRCSA